MENEVLNQEQTTSEDEGFFDDITDEEIDDLPVEDETEANDKQAEEQPQTDDFLDIRYNKENVRLNREQAIEYAQKGMNYDKLNERFTGLNSKIEKLARDNGLTADEFLDRLEQTQWSYEVSKEMDALKEQYPIDEEAEDYEAKVQLLQELAEARTSQRLGDVQMQRQHQLEEQQNALRQQAQGDVQKLFSLYPELAQGGNPMANIPREVLELANETHDLTYAYSLWRNKQAEMNRPAIEAKQKAQELNSRNQSRSYGSTTNAGNTKQDDFLAGWNEEE